MISREQIMAFSKFITEQRMSLGYVVDRFSDLANSISKLEDQLDSLDSYLKNLPMKEDE